MSSISNLLFCISLACSFHITGISKSKAAEARQKTLAVEGLYYLDSGPDDDSTVALVITRKGNRIQHKLNDPEAPIEPRLYIGKQYYRFLAWSVSPKQVTFKTESTGGRSYRFRALVHLVTYSDIPNVPELRGLLTESDGVRSTPKRVRFAHAVIA